MHEASVEVEENDRFYANEKEVNEAVSHVLSNKVSEADINDPQEENESELEIDSVSKGFVIQKSTDPMTIREVKKRKPKIAVRVASGTQSDVSIV